MNEQYDMIVYFPVGTRWERPIGWKWGYTCSAFFDWIADRGYEIVTYRLDLGSSPERNQIWAKVRIP
jgi:hypothetical protein